MASSDDDFQLTPMPANLNRRQYLVTYSKANLLKFPSNRSFGETLADAFSASGKVGVEYWACCTEAHADGESKHYHCSVKLTGPKRWNPVKETMKKRHGIISNFKDNNENYYTAYRYVCKEKEDMDVYKSPGHPPLEDIGSPPTKKAMTAYRKKSASSHNEKGPSSSSRVKGSAGACRLSSYKLTKFIANHNIENTNDLWVKAKKMEEVGKTDLANCLLGKTPKAQDDLFASAWEMENAKAKVDRESISRMQLIRQAGNNDCVDGFDGEWLKCATQVLRQNSIHPYVFTEALRDLPTNGREKFRTILLLGPTNFGKTFLLLPLDKILKAFCNPANKKYA